MINKCKHVVDFCLPVLQGACIRRLSRDDLRFDHDRVEFFIDHEDD